MPKLFEPLDDFKTIDLPEKQLPFWKIAGPGAILVGLSIGAGEIVIWPLIAAEYGASMVWAAVLGVFLQLWINFEVGRWTIATGETVYTGYSRIWRGFGPLFILLTVVGWIAPGWARASGLALKALLIGPGGWGSDTFWTVITFAAVALILFGPKMVYQSVERTVELLVAIVTIGLILVVIAVGSLDTWKELGSGIINVGHVAEGMSVKSLFIAIVFAGAGGTANLFYTFYLRDKNIGMGARLPSLRNPLRGRDETISSTGFLFEETEENKRRFSAWWKYIKQDQMIFFWALNTVTILLFIFGALAVLHPQGIVPEKGQLIYDEANILKGIWGMPGQYIFLLVGVATLFGTQLALVDGVGRSISDIIYTNFKGAKKRPLSWWYLLIAGIWIVGGCVITFVMEQLNVSELGFLFNAAYMGGFAMALYVPLTLYMNYRFLPKIAKPKTMSTIMMFIASAVYIGFAISSIIWEIKRLIGG
ncbi:MAG: Nramp family divalent metal transporter [Candidatus Poribacteria bacterium]|nr:Nramp family divalent metal transporter [Candidatus Poribacteria bacterium]